MEHQLRRVGVQNNVVTSRPARSLTIDATASIRAEYAVEQYPSSKEAHAGRKEVCAVPTKVTIRRSLCSQRGSACGGGALTYAPGGPERTRGSRGSRAATSKARSMYYTKSVNRPPRVGHNGQRDCHIRASAPTDVNSRLGTCHHRVSRVPCAHIRHVCKLDACQAQILAVWWF